MHGCKNSGPFSLSHAKQLLNSEVQKFKLHIHLQRAQFESVIYLLGPMACTRSHSRGYSRFLSKN